jgi:hypothetical protein
VNIGRGDESPPPIRGISTAEPSFEEGVHMRAVRHWPALIALLALLALPQPALAGDNVDTPGVFRSGTWYLSNSFGGSGDYIFGFGNSSGDRAVVGDWNGDGNDSPGVYRGDTWYLSNGYGGAVDAAFAYGLAGDKPVAGDWNGDGIDTPGVVRGTTWFLSNSFGGSGDYVFSYGLSSDIPVVGDWDGNGTDTPGVLRGATWYLRNSNSGGGHDITFVYGVSGDRPVVGDWNANGVDTIGVFRDATWFLRNSNSGGGHDISFGYGVSGDTPVPGDWAGSAPPPPPPPTDPPPPPPPPTDPPPPAFRPPVDVSQNQWGVTFINNDATWVVYKDCFGMNYRGGTNLTVGPGYIARVTRKDGVKIVEDERKLWTPSPTDPGKFLEPGGGLGGFAWHHARGPLSGFQFSNNNAWPIEGRYCFSDLGFGVHRTVVSGPTKFSDTEAGLEMDVYFREWCSSRDIMRVTYKYRVYPSVVKLWVLVTELDDGCVAYAPDALAFIKEPKFVAKVLPANYTRLQVFKNDNTLAENQQESNQCSWLGANPQADTRQCDNDRRARFRWDYGTTVTGAGNCGSVTSNPCLAVVGRAYDNASHLPLFGTTYLWEKSGRGIDHWAVVSTPPARAQANTVDGPEGGGFHPGTCNRPLNGELERRWELTGGPGWGGFTGLMHGWEGGTGAYDCEPQSVRFGPQNESWGMHFQFSINDGWSLQ